MRQYHRFSRPVETGGIMYDSPLPTMDESPAPDDHRPTVAAAKVSRRRCQMALMPGSGPKLTNEINVLLHRRLRLAALISAVGSTFFLVNRLLGTPTVLTSEGLAL